MTVWLKESSCSITPQTCHTTLTTNPTTTATTEREPFLSLSHFISQTFHFESHHQTLIPPQLRSQSSHFNLSASLRKFSIPNFIHCLRISDLFLSLALNLYCFEKNQSEKMEAIEELAQLSDSMRQASALLADEDVDESSSSSSSSSSKRPSSFLNVVVLGNVVCTFPSLSNYI